MPERFPALFVSHGAPTLPLESSAAQAFLSGLGSTLGKPTAILAVSAHWESGEPALGAAARPQTIHDFFGFPEPLYRLEYPAPGAPQLAARAAALLEGAGFAAQTNATRGLDHGAWVPLLLMYPEADIPVVQLAVQPERDTRHHFALGAALRPLRDEGVLILGSGGATHNLYEFGRHARNAPPPEWVSAFQEWLAQTIESAAQDDLLEYRTRAPHAARNHPSEEHLLPIFTAAGAGAPGVAGRRIHRSHSYGILAMDAYQFD